MTQNIVQSKSQRFADIVFPKVQEIAVTERAAKYKTLCKKAGGLIRNSGLMQTLAFFRAKGQKKNEKHHLDLYEHLAEELRTLGVLGKEDLFEYTRKAGVPDYMYLTTEVLHLLNWHRRLAETLIKKDKKENGGDGDD